MNTFYLTLFALLTANIISAQTIHYVRSGSTGDGSSWQNASGSLQNMLIAANPDDEIWVASGIYKPETQIQDPTNLTNPVVRTSTFTLVTGVKLYGAFPPTGNPTMGDRDISIHETILSGDIGVVNDSADNCFHVLFFPNVSRVLIDGFTITGGTANANGLNGSATSYVPSLSTNINNYHGGAAYIYQGDSITISNCQVSGNMAGYEGGGLYTQDGNHFFYYNRFLNNKGGGFGGAVYSVGGSHTFDLNSFVSNRVVLQSGGAFPMPTPNYYASGGAIATKNGSHVFTENIFTENEARVSNNTTNAQGGALYLENGSHTISENLFSSNQSVYLPTGVQVSYGGAIYTNNANTTTEYNDFIENLTHGSGGAVSFNSGNHTLQANLFDGNSAVGLGGAVSCNSTTLHAVNNIFFRNTSGNNAGAIHSAYAGGTNRFVNNTFYGNAAAQTGGAMYFDSRQDHVLNNIFWNNTANGSSTANGADFTFYNSGGSTFLNNLYQTGSDPENPLFVDAANGDFTLSSNSPAINAGDNTHYLSSYSLFDFDGNNRIENDTIDIGAIEFINGSSTSIINTVAKSRISVYPNPASQQLNIITDAENTLTNISVIDMQGKIVMNTTADGSTLTLFMGQLPGGVYSIKVDTKQNITYHRIHKL